MASNKSSLRASRQAAELAQEAANQARQDREAAAAAADLNSFDGRLRDLRTDLRSIDQDIALDALDELVQIGSTLGPHEERRRQMVWTILSSRIARKVEMYREQGPDIRIDPPPSQDQ